MDRTNEFFAYANTLPKPSTSINTASAMSEKSSNASALSDDTNQLRNFHSTASGISRDIAGTSQLLAELTKLVRRRGLFTEEADNNKVNELIGVIKENVQDLNMRLDDSAALIAREKNKKKSFSSKNKTSQPVQEASNLVGRLQEEFVQTTAGFKAVLQQRSDRMKENKDWKNKFHGKSSTSSSSNNSIHLGPKLQPGVKSRNMNFQPLNLGTPPMNVNTTLTSTPAGEVTSSLPRPRGVIGQGGGSTTSTPYGSRAPSALTPIQIQRMEAESGNEQMMQLIPDQNYLQERADQMSQVEANIVELGTIFNKLAVMVNEHKEMVQRVEDNVEDANMSIQDSLFTLTNTLESLKTNRALVMKISGVLILFIILFVTVFA
mmetsp:Transcript_10727/g.15956  ORF Transcript_10727/g.15956 Transcript_10727/m.15956 type:complete len:377 (-) Transcript_10727:129-1259(-)|eukprot:CAMPEP_0196801354 /NCGR_PEP_ID=MMETSP1362-20130617/1100_1 /TAXON_ID=163516 /ORGANISM="Leptocylindrus danicus, Strain CCMP1856" /LENGTH=376 /DNA_ID=CAMNT_0042172267 /DNA_START=43 /DNA_END=1173 /DNA_ORIENTATION=+